MVKKSKYKTIEKIQQEIQDTEKEHMKVSKAHWAIKGDLDQRLERERRSILLSGRIIQKAGPWRLETYGSSNTPALYALGDTTDLEELTRDSWGGHYSFDLFGGIEIRVDDSEFKLIAKQPGALEKAVDRFDLEVHVANVGSVLAEKKAAIDSLERVFNMFTGKRKSRNETKNVVPKRTRSKKS